MRVIALVMEVINAQRHDRVNPSPLLTVTHDDAGAVIRYIDSINLIREAAEQRHLLSNSAIRHNEQAHASMR